LGAPRRALPGAGDGRRRPAQAGVRRGDLGLRHLAALAARTRARPSQERLRERGLKTARLSTLTRIVMIHSRRSLVALPLSLLLAGLPLAPAQAADVFRVSAIPDESPTELQRKFKPLGEHLERKLGMKVEFTPVT